jgi:hypothetical protein
MAILPWPDLHATTPVGVGSGSEVPVDRAERI